MTILVSYFMKQIYMINIYDTLIVKHQKFVVTHSFENCCLPFSYLHFQGQGQRTMVTVIEFIGLVIKSSFMVEIRLIFSTKLVMCKVNTKRISEMFHRQNS